MSGFARSETRRSIRQGEADDVVRYTKVLCRPVPRQRRRRRRSGYVSLLSLSSSLFFPRRLCPRATPFPPFSFPEAPRFVLREAAERNIPFLTPILHRFQPSALLSPLSAVRIPLSSLSPYSRPALSSPFFLNLPPHSLYSRYTSPRVLDPTCYA